MSQPINDINGAANNLLNQVKKPQAKTSFTSKLSKSELARESEEIVNAILAEIKGSDIYNRDLQSKLSDVIMGRITYLKKKSGELTAEDLEALKSELSEKLQETSGLDDKSKELLQQIVEKQVTESESKEELLKELQEIKDTTDNLEEKSEEGEEGSDSSEQFESQKGFISSSFDTVKSYISSQMASFQDKFEGFNEQIAGFSKDVMNSVTSPFKSIEGKFTQFGQGLQDSIQQVKSGLSDKFAEVTDGISQKVQGMKDGLANGFKNTIGGITGAFSKLNPLSGKDKKAEKAAKARMSQIDKLMKRINDICDNFKDYALNFLQEIVIPAAKILAKGINIILKPIMTSLITLFWTTIGPLLAIIAVGIAVVLPIIAKAIEKMAPIIATAILKVVEILGTIVGFLIDKIWPFFTDQLWPFIKEELWPFAKDMLTWVRDKIITPVWEKFVVPLLEWVVKSLMPWIDKYVLPNLGKVLNWLVKEVLPVLTTVLKLIERVLIEDVEKIILPIVQGLGKVIQAVADTVVSVINGVKEVLMSTLKVIKGIIETVGEAIKAVINGIKDVIVAILQNIEKVINALGENITKVVNAVGDAVVAVIRPVKELFDGIGEIIKEVMHFMKDVIVKALDNIRPQVIELLSKHIPHIMEKMLVFVDKTLDVMIGIMKGIESVVNAIKGVISKVIDIGGTVKDAVGGAFKKIGGWFSGDDEPQTPEQKLEAQMKALEEARKEVIEVDKGTVYDILQKVTGILDILEKSIDHKLDMVISHFGISESGDKASITNTAYQITEGNRQTINNINSTTQDSALELPERDGMKISKKNSGDGVMDFLRGFAQMANENFEIIKQKLDSPQLMPLPIPSEGGSNQAMEDL